MNEWGVVGVIIALVGLIFTVSNPVIKLTKSITELAILVRELRKDMDEHREKSIASHQKLWDKNGEQDSVIADHEKRITVLENR